MARLSPKYFHYFLASLSFDSVLLFVLFNYLIYAPRLDGILLLWLISQFLNYPRVSHRRYVSYFKVLLLLVWQYITFFVLYFFMAYFFIESWWNSDFLLNLLLIACCSFISKTLFVYLVRLYRILGFGYSRFLVIGDTPKLRRVVDDLLSQKEAGHIQVNALKYIQDFDILEQEIIKTKLNEIYCSPTHVSHLQLAKLMLIALRNDVNLYIVSDDGVLTKKQDDLFEFMPLLDQWNLFLKRCIDIIGSVLVIIGVLSWLVPLMSLLIKLDSKGPVFFIQPRAGKNGKYFMCLKFRSMKVSDDIKQASRNDIRVTKVGAFIRRTSIDEFPQFINVFLGQMSIVGPRPHIKSLNDQFSHSVEKYDYRLLVKPGITGLSQVMGYRGETTDSQSMLNRIRVDLLYIRNWSLGLDLMILFKTISKNIFIVDKNAY